MFRYLTQIQASNVSNASNVSEEEKLRIASAYQHPIRPWLAKTEVDKILLPILSIVLCIGSLPITHKTRNLITPTFVQYQSKSVSDGVEVLSQNNSPANNSNHKIVDTNSFETEPQSGYKIVDLDTYNEIDVLETLNAFYNQPFILKNVYFITLTFESFDIRETGDKNLSLVVPRGTLRLQTYLVPKHCIPLLQNNVKRIKTEIKLQKERYAGQFIIRNDEPGSDRFNISECKNQILRYDQFVNREYNLDNKNLHTCGLDEDGDFSDVYGVSTNHCVPTNMILKTLGSVNNLQVQRLDELEKIYLSSSTSVTKDFSLADILTSGNSDNQNIEESKQDAVSAENAVINSETPFVTPTSDTNTQKFDNQSLNSPIPSQEETHALPQVSNESLSSQVELQIFNRLLLDPFNLDLITKEIKEINELYKPKKGNRKAARKLNDQALEALHNDNIEQAIIFLNQAIQSDGSDSEIINNLASAYGRQYNYAKQIEYSYEALKIKPNRKYAWHDLARGLALTESIDKAKNAFILSYQLSNKKEQDLAFLQTPSAKEDPIVQIIMISAYNEIINKK